MAQSSSAQLAISTPIIRSAGDPSSAPASARPPKGKSAKVKVKPVSGKSARTATKARRRTTKPPQPSAPLFAVAVKSRDSMKPVVTICDKSLAEAMAMAKMFNAVRPYVNDEAFVVAQPFSKGIFEDATVDDESEGGAE